MTIEVIAAGLGRNGTLSMKFALEALGLGPCHHMTEVLAYRTRQVPLWLDTASGSPDWDAIFDGYRSTSDYPSATYWREIADRYPDAKVVLTTRDPDAWFDSVSDTIFAPRMMESMAGTPVAAMMRATIFDPLGCDPGDRARVTDWYARRNAEVVRGIAPERLFVFDPREGWGPLCRFLGVAVPNLPFPRANRRAALGSPSATSRSFAGSSETHERFTRLYIETMRRSAFEAGRVPASLSL